MTSGEEAAGSRYRKIALNGRPMADEKPQHTEETSQAKEETYVDALNLRLNHSVTDIYIPLPGGELALSVRRNAAEESWNNTSGLTPDQRPDLPFGAGWSSNLCPNVHVIEHIRGVQDDPCLRLSATYVYVTDENGQTYKFVRLIQAGVAGFVYQALPSNGIEDASYDCSLTGDNGSFSFSKSRGVDIEYTGTPFQLTLLPDRNHPERQTQYEVHTWTRVASVQDRLGNRLDYTGSFLPSVITATPGGQSIQIEYEGNHIRSIKDPARNVFQYGYTTVTDGIVTCPALASVTAPPIVTADGPVSGITRYSYDVAAELDTRPLPPDSPAPNPPLYHYHANVSRIVDPLGQTYDFVYQIDQSSHAFDTATGLNFTINGQPRWVSQITSPSGVATFLSLGSVSFDGTLAHGFRMTEVHDAAGYKQTYDFGTPVVRIMNDWSDYLTSTDGDRRRIPQLLVYTSLQLGHTVSLAPGAPVLPLESYTFDPDAGLALASLSDLSGNVTTYTYDSVLPPGPFGLPFGSRTDPTSEQRTWTFDGPPVAVQKEFTYGIYRVMSSATDERGVLTEYDLDPSRGRRTAERITNGGTEVVQETWFEYDLTIPGFLNRKIVRRLPGSEDEEWAGDLVTDYVPDSCGRIAREIVDPDRPGHVGMRITTIHSYDDNGNKTQTIDPNGYTHTFAYDALNRLIKVTDQGIGAKSFTYDLRGNKTSETDENGYTTLFEYDTLNRLITQTRVMPGSDDLITRHQYDDVGNRTQTKDPNGNITRMEYDGLQRLIKTWDAANQPTTFEYDIADNPGTSSFDTSSFKPTKITDPRGVETRMRYDTLYRLREKLVEFEPGLFSRTRMNTDQVGNVVEEFDPLNHLINRNYDALNRVTITAYTNDDGLSTEIRKYTNTGLLYWVIDELYNSTFHEYDRAGRLVKVTAPQVDDGTGTIAYPITQTVYDPQGNVIAKIDPLLNRTDFEYDVRRRKVLERRPAAVDATTGLTVRSEVQWAYDGVGNVTGTTDERGNLTRSYYDGAHRVIEVRGPAVAYGATGAATGQPTTRSRYDANGNVLEVIDPNGNITANTYDVLNRLKTTTNGAGITVRYDYDAVGNRISVTDGKNQTTTMAYDGLNRLTTTTDPASQTTTLAYDALNKVSRTDAAGQVTEYAYDVRNRLQQTTHAGRSADDQTFTYDYTGKLLSVVEPGKSGLADVAYTYDALHRVIGETSGGQTHTYLYDLAGNRTHVTYGGTQHHLVSVYDALHRLAYQTEEGRTFSYAYDLHGNIVGKNLPNEETVAQTFDALNRVISIEGRQPFAGDLLYRSSYRYDLAGNVVFIREDQQDLPTPIWREITQLYDQAHRLTTEQFRHSGATFLGGGGDRNVVYSYDAADNRTARETQVLTPVREVYTYNDLNQLVHRETSQPAIPAQDAFSQAADYAYDLNGNRKSRTTDIVTTFYGYDYDHRLITVEAFEEGLYTYTYDYRTRRVGIINNFGSNFPIGHTVFSFSGGTYVQESKDGTLQAEFIRGSDFGGGIGGLLYSLRGGVPSYTHYNHRGDVVAKTNTAHSLTYRAAYEAYGTRTGQSGGTADRQRANTKDEDPTGLLNEGYRYRDLATGEFITRDPLGFVNGPNLYTYVRQNPWSKFDPEGLEETLAGAKVTRKQHHIVPVNSWDKNSLSREVQEQLNEARIGKDGVDHGGAGHREYNKRAEKIVSDYTNAAKKAGNDPSGLTGQKAKDFADGLIKEFESTKDAYVRGFNAQVRAGRTQAELAQWGAAMRKAEMQAGKLGAIIDATRTVAKWGARGALVLTVAAVIADTAEAGPTIAAQNLVKSATFYDITVQPLGNWYNKTYEEMEQGTMNNDNPLGRNFNEKRRWLNEGGLFNEDKN